MRHLPLLIAILATSACGPLRLSNLRDMRDREKLNESAELFWMALRWSDLTAAASYYADPVQRMAWLEEQQSGEAKRYRSAAVLQVNTTPLHEVDERGCVREGGVIAQVEYYRMPTQVLVQELVPQKWCQASGGNWFLLPEEE